MLIKIYTNMFVILILYFATTFWELESFIDEN